ncbi:prolyl oligopeptidase family serine peptidase [Variovorax sp. J22P271]|uniref:S9 family peptidase n=1 Tax=Variovorax davisae TaxID=3053515 RepID=UPI00257775A8|nr:prolyl oligopeptidase family serine peptidase [Variovorax sp. J22P271]MDM0032171.1 prolyl oligopeptidase family serine peptidase [Variovorax sp. J22P271]
MDHTKRTFRPEDLYLQRKITDIECHPDRAVAACSVRSVDQENDKYASSIWQFSLAGGDASQLTRGTGDDNSPRWSPDGRQLAFLSDRGGSPQVHILAIDGGEAKQLSRLPQSVSDLRWMPAGDALVVTAAVVDDPDTRSLSGGTGGQSGQSNIGKQLEVARKKCAPEVAWRLPYKEDGVGYLLRRQFHLFRVDATTGDHIQLSQGAFDVLAFDVARDGSIAYSRSRDGRFAHSNDLWICGPLGRDARRVTRDIAIVMHPAWSPDGRIIAFTSAEEEGDAEPRLWLLDVATGEARTVCEATLDVAHPAALHWVDDARLVLTRAFRGRHQVVMLDVGRESFEVLSQGDRQIGIFDCNATHIAFTVDHPSLPCELWSAARDGRDEKKSSNLNAWWGDRQAIDVQLLEFEVPDGHGGIERIEGWLLRQQGRLGPSPLLVDAHGGPAAYALLDFDTNVFWQVLSALATGQSNAFSAAVVMAPVGNIETHYGTSDGGYYADPFYVASKPMFDREKARELSPLHYVEKSETPTLFLQGKEDERCPKCQSEELFVSLSRAGNTPAELVLYPGETHAFLGSGAPSCREDAAACIVAWLNRFVGV